MALIAPSMLSADFARLAEEITAVEAAGADWIHVDVMDGRFVPNLTVGPPVVAALRKVTHLPLDVHLMIEEPERSIPAYRKAGADWISIHAEATRHLQRALAMIRDEGAHPAVALNPATPLSALDHVWNDIEMVLLMTVNPGFGGQAFLPAMIEKIRALSGKTERRVPEVKIEVDGGVNADNAGELLRAGASVFVAGTAIFGNQDYGAAIRGMRRALSSNPT
jgi:ribulose-phosphate 3-epimerase